MVRSVPGKSRESLAPILEEHLASRTGHPLEDYADTTVRYLRMAGLFTVAGEKLVIKEDRQADR